MISKYIYATIRQIESSPLVVRNDLRSFLDSPQKGYITGTIVFLDNSILTMIEVLEEQRHKIEKVKYRYHYMDRNKKLIFRYDNAPHLKNLKTFPHHKHIPIKNKVKGVVSSMPLLKQVLNEIAEYVYRNL